MQNQPDRILRVREVCERVGLSRSTVWRLSRRGKFPVAVQLSSAATVGFLEAEVVEWIAERMASRKQYAKK
jgi:prophage regulatory protein